MKFSLRTLLLVPVLLVPLLVVWRQLSPPLTLQAVVALAAAFLFYVLCSVSRRLARSVWDESDPLVFVCRGAMRGAGVGALALNLLAAPVLLHSFFHSAAATTPLVLGIAALGASLGAFLGSCAGFVFDLYVAVFRSDLRRAHRLRHRARESRTYV